MEQIKRFLGGGAIMFVGTVVSGGFSYLFNVFVARLLGPGNYSEVLAILNLATIISVATTAVSLTSMQYAGQYYYSGHGERLRHTFWVLLTRVAAIGVGLAILTAIFVMPVSRFFSISNTSAALLSLLFVPISLIATVHRGYLQGVQRFLAVSVAVSVEMLARFVLLFIFVKLGWGVAGAVGATIGASVLSYLSTIPFIIRLLKGPLPTSSEVAPELSAKKMLKDALPSFLASFFLTVFLSADILVVKRTFDADTAGQYGSISSIAKIIVFLSAPVVGVMFPMIAERRAKGEKHYQTLLFALVLTLGISVFILVAYTLFTGKIVGILYGDKFGSASSLLPQVGMMALLYSLVAVFANYFVAIRDKWFLWIFALGGVLQIVLVELHSHPTLEETVRSFIAVQALLLILFIARYLYEKRVAMGQVMRSR